MRRSSLAIPFACWYFELMRFPTLRRIFALLLALTLVVGLAAHGVGVSDMGVKMATASASDMPMSGPCGECSNDKAGMSTGMCAAYCSAGSFLLLAAEAFDVPHAGSTGFLVPGLTLPSHGSPPDPYPPRPAVLS
jgi:hypothetical protein